jgi:hypothetical protein
MADTVQRAFELARSGECATVADVRKRLRSEQRDQVDSHLSGRSIRTQLRQILDEVSAAA